MQGADCNANFRPEPNGEQENKMTQRTEFEIEVSETVAYGSRNERFENFCPTCKCMTEMATPQVGAILGRTTEREIYRLVETGDVHFVETDRVLVCLNSLPGYQQNSTQHEEQL